MTHPVLYVSGNAGVYRSIDGGQTWSLFPASAANLDGSPQNGGYLPNVKVTNLNLSIGAVNSTTGANVTQPGDSNLLTATTDGQGVFAIRLGPMIFPNSATQPQILGLDPSSFTGTVNGSNVTRVANPLIDGYTEQSTSGSDVYVSLYDMSNPSKPVLIGGYNPASQATATAAINTLTGTVTSIKVTQRWLGLHDPAGRCADRRRLHQRRDGDGRPGPVPTPTGHCRSPSAVVRATPTPPPSRSRCPRPAATSPPTSTATSASRSRRATSRPTGPRRSGSRPPTRPVKRGTCNC